MNFEPTRITVKRGVLEYKRLVPALIQWVMHFQYIARGRVDRFSGITHTFMGGTRNGGLLMIPPDMLDEVRKYCAMDFNSQFRILHPLSETIMSNGIAEIVLRFFVEFDVPEQENSLWTVEYQTKIAKVLAKTLAAFKSGDFFVYLSVKFDFDDEVKHFGSIHIQTSACLTVNQAKRLYGLFLSNLDLEIPRNSQTHLFKWEDLLDPNVINDSKINLRQNFASKKIKCPQCYGRCLETGEICEQNCDDDKMITKRQVYIVLHVLDRDGNIANGELARIKVDVAVELAATSIRPAENRADDDIIVPEHCPPPLDYKVKKNDSFDDTKVATGISKLQNGTDRNGVVIPSSDSRFAVICGIIKNLKIWSQIQIHTIRVIQKANGISYSAYTKGPTSNFCMNKPASRDGCLYGEHTSIGRIYFELRLSARGHFFVYQRCWGEKAGKTKGEQGQEKKCKEGCTEVCRIRDEHVQSLFNFSNGRINYNTKNSNGIHCSTGPNGTPIATSSIQKKTDNLTQIVRKGHVFKLSAKKTSNSSNSEERLAKKEIAASTDLQVLEAMSQMSTKELSFSQDQFLHKMSKKRQLEISSNSETDSTDSIGSGIAKKECRQISQTAISLTRKSNLQLKKKLMELGPQSIAQSK